MNIKDFLNGIENQAINTQLVNEVAKSYGVELTEYIKKLLSASSESIFFESDDILRLLSYTDIVKAPEDLSVDFIGLQLIPLFDTGDNDYIVFDIGNDNWCKFNIVDAVKFKQKSMLNDFFR